MTSRSWLTICLYVVGLGLGTLLLVQHWVHVPAFLPYLVFLACPLMHLLMHRGHGGHRGHEHTPGSREGSAER